MITEEPRLKAGDADLPDRDGHKMVHASWRPETPPPGGSDLSRRLKDRVAQLDLWLSDSLGGSRPQDEIWLERLRSLALAGAAVTLPMSAWKAIGPLTTADLFLAAAVFLFLPRFDLRAARRLWVPALAIALAVLGGLVGTVVSGSDMVASGEIMSRVLAASIGSMVLVCCWQPGLEQVRSFGLLWVSGGVASALVALFIPHLHMFIRPSGLTPHPNHLAIISMILLGVALSLILSERERDPCFGGFRLWSALGAAGLLFAGIVASGSRAGLGAALIVCFLAVVATRDRRIVRIAVVLAGIGLVMAAIGLGGQDNALDRIVSGDESSSVAREEHNGAAWDRFTAYPITGVGFDDVTDAHIFMLQFASAAGLLGIVAGLMIIFLAVRTYVAAVWRGENQNSVRRLVVGGFAASVLGYLAASVFQNVLWDRNVWLAIVLMTWLAAAPARTYD